MQLTGELETEMNDKKPVITKVMYMNMNHQVFHLLPYSKHAHSLKVTGFNRVGFIRAY